MPATVRSHSSHPLAAPLAVGCCLAVGAVAVAAVDPSEASVVPPCPFRSITGWWCPACGLTRATHHLLRGDVVAALRFNVFVVVVLAAIGASWLTWLARAHGRSTVRSVDVPAWARVAAALAVAGFAVARNLPGVPGLRG